MATAEDSQKEDCRYCGEPVDTLEPGHMKSPGDKFAHPQCVADDCFGDRERFATDEGVFRMQSVKVTKTVGHQEEVIDSYWQADCPVCYRTHETDDRTEDAREDLFDEVCECCGAEWIPPEDWIEDCEICGTSHRESHECKAVSHREPFPGVEEDYECVDCGWDGRGTDLKGPVGECPECDSRSVRVVDDAE